MASYVDMKRFYEKKRNRLENYDPEGEVKGGKRTYHAFRWSPRMLDRKSLRER